MIKCLIHQGNKKTFEKKDSFAARNYLPCLDKNSCLENKNSKNNQFAPVSVSMVIRHYAYVVKVIFHKIWLFCQFVVFYILIDVFLRPIWRIYNNNSSFITNRFGTLFLHRIARVYYVSYITCRLISKISKKMNLIRIWINDG